MPRNNPSIPKSNIICLGITPIFPKSFLCFKIVLCRKTNIILYRLGVANEKFSSLPLTTLTELKPLSKTLYSLKINNNGFQSLPNLLQGNTTFEKLRILDISHNSINGK